MEEPQWRLLDLTGLCERAASATLALHGLSTDACELSLLATSDSEIAILNQTFRGKARPTNVLSWPAQDLAPDTPGATPAAPGRDPDGMIPLGDIALAFETCAREAAEQKKPLGVHVTHLIVHGLLHLLGYDHETEADAALMEGLEITILETLGLPDPYAFSDGSGTDDLDKD